MKTYKIKSTISTSNGSVEIRRRNKSYTIDMNVRFTASVVKVKAQYFYLGRVFSHDVTVGATGSGQISVFEMYKLFGDDLKGLLESKEDSKIQIIGRADSDDNEYNHRTVILKDVIFDQMDLFNLDEQNIGTETTIPFTFGDIEFVSDFNQ